MQDGLPRPWDASRLPDPVIPVDRTFEGFLGLEWLELTPSSARVRFETRDDLKQPLGLLHGGIYCAVAETVASLATAYEVWEDGLVASGLSNSANFLRPITAGTVDVACRLRERGDDAWLWSTDFRDEADRLCAIVDVMVAVRPVPADVPSS